MSEARKGEGGKRATKFKKNAAPAKPEKAKAGLLT